MGKHDIIKPSSTERVRKHRAEMKAKGYRLAQIWSPSPNDAAFRAEVEHANRVIAAHPEEDAAAMEWIERMTKGEAQIEPDYK